MEAAAAAAAAAAVHVLVALRLEGFKECARAGPASQRCPTCVRGCARAHARATECKCGYACCTAV